MMVNELLAEHRADMLLLLVGTNPLPVLVSADVLAAENATVYLLHSDRQEQFATTETKLIAEFIAVQLKQRRPDVQVKLHGLHETSGAAIKQGVDKLVSDNALTGNVGLNYTGGTKAMAVHVYQTLRDCGGKFERLTFSYLDPRTQSMWIDSEYSSYPVAKAVQLTFDKIAALHGYQRKGQPVEPLRTEPCLQKLCAALLAVHLDNVARQQYNAWLNQRHKEADGQEKAALRDLPNLDCYPDLADLRRAMDEVCGGSATPETLTQAINPAWRELNSCRKWFKSDWLEELALAALGEVASHVEMTEYGINAVLEPSPELLKALKNQGLWTAKEPPHFELDVVGVRGYQLFVLSCINSDHADGETKNHLFQAFTRARQLGGDEARIALICLAGEPERVEAEIAREWQTAGQIKVFGRDDLSELASRLRDWIEKAHS